MSIIDGLCKVNASDDTNCNLKKIHRKNLAKKDKIKHTHALSRITYVLGLEPQAYGWSAIQIVLYQLISHY